VPQAATATSDANKLQDQRILNAPVTVDLPRLNSIEVAGNRSRRSKELRLDAPEFGQFDGRGLGLASFIVQRDCSTVSPPSQVQANPKRVCAFEFTGPWISASFQVARCLLKLRPCGSLLRRTTPIR